jgi:formate dehydrogenase iron-sulfur subunit
MTVREKELAKLAPGEDLPRGRLSALVDRLIGPFRRGVPPQPRPAYGFYTDTTVCIGCKACEVACKQWNQLPADGFHWTGNSYDNTGELSATSWRHVKFIEQLSEEGARDEGRGTREENASRQSLPLVSPPSPLAPRPSPLTPGRWLMMSDVCKHCVVAPCQQACPTGAILHNEFENVYIQPDICNGCAYCIAACPFGVITRASFDGHAHKCTLCYDRQRDGLVPACAKACPTASIQFGPIDELHQRARERVEELRRRGVRGAHLYGDKPQSTYSGLNSFYLLVDRPSVYGLPEGPFNPWLHMKGDYVRALTAALAGLVMLALAFLLLGP